MPPTCLRLLAAHGVSGSFGMPATKVSSENIPDRTPLTDCSTYALTLVIHQIPWIHVHQRPTWDKHWPNYRKCYGRHKGGI